MSAASLRLIPALLGLFAGIACAQPTPKADIFAGFSFANADLGTGSHAPTYGYEWAGQFKVRRWLGIVIMNDGHFGNAMVPACLGSTVSSCVNLMTSSFAQLYTTSGGLEVSKQRGRATPFARALFGLATRSACPVYTCESKGSFAQAYGGGVEYRITERRLSWRMQAEFLETRFFSSTQNDLRVATGLTINLYGHGH